MMWGFKAVLFGVLFIAPSMALTEGVVGNGGDAVVCRNANGEIRTAELLDFYEARIRGIENQVGNPSTSYEANLNRALEVLSQRNPTRVSRYREWFKSFPDEAKFIPNYVLVDVPDSDHIGMPSGCKVEQVVIQAEPKVPEDKRYTFNKDIWDRLSTVDKAGLVLHEFIYRESVQGGAKNSMMSRYINSLVWSRKILSLPLKAYVTFLAKSFFTDFDHQGLLLSTRVKWADNDQLMEATVLGGKFKNANSEVIFRAGTEMRWANSTQPTSGEIVKGTIVFNGQKLPLDDGSSISWYPSGAHEEFKLAVPLTLESEMYKLSFKPKTTLRFHPNGAFYMCPLVGFACAEGALLKVQGSWRTLSFLGPSEFYPNGHINSLFRGVEEGPVKPYQIQNRTYFTTEPPVFYPDGTVRYVILKETVNEFEVNRKVVRFFGGPVCKAAGKNESCGLEFNPAGAVLSGILAEASDLRTPTGEVLHVNAGYSVRLNDAGEVLEVRQVFK